tara:strand:- start:599 stop:832 length:234 start_codon:yes stop_codon:yes gene_type:complete
LDKLYQIDIVFDFYEKLTKKRIESSDLETAVEEAIKFLNDYKDNNAFVHEACMIIAKEKVIIKQKVIDLINRRNNGK